MARKNERIIGIGSSVWWIWLDKDRNLMYWIVKKINFDSYEIEGYRTRKKDEKSIYTVPKSKVKIDI